MAQRQESEANPGDIVEYMRCGGDEILRGEIVSVCYGAEGVSYLVSDAAQYAGKQTFVAACDSVSRVWRAE